MKKIIIIEDDPAILKGLTETLKEEHFEVTSIMDGEKGFKLCLEESTDLIILDLMLPSKNGIDICKDLRAEGIQTPILMLTSKKEEVDKVLGLEIGADDYVTKPFSIRELLARIKVLLRRNPNLLKETESVSFDNVVVNFKKLEAMRNNEKIDMSITEFNLLRYLVNKESEVISRHQLLDDVWGYENFPTTRTIDNFILNLRKKLETDPSNPKHILTIHKVGYKFIR